MDVPPPVDWDVELTSTHGGVLDALQAAQIDVFCSWFTAETADDDAFEIWAARAWLEAAVVAAAAALLNPSPYAMAWPTLTTHVNRSAIMVNAIAASTIAWPGHCPSPNHPRVLRRWCARRDGSILVDRVALVSTDLHVLSVDL
jgi:hypothetical protein